MLSMSKERTGKGCSRNMEETRQESTVSVQSHFRTSPTLSALKRRRCREDSAVSCCNLEKPRPVKAFRSNASEARTRTRDSLLNFHQIDSFKHGNQEDAIKLEKQGGKSISGSGVVGKNLKLKGELETLASDGKQFVLPLGKIDIISSNGRHNMSGKPCISADHQRREVSQNKTRELLAPEDKKLKYASINLSPLHMNQPDVEETALVDVRLKVDATCRVENAPFVSLTSQVNGKAILGHHLEIRKLRDSSKSLVPKKESGSLKLFEDDGPSRLQKLVWRTSKRTPVSYVTKIACQSKQGTAAPSTTCVPVEHVFGRILRQSGR